MLLAIQGIVIAFGFWNGGCILLTARYFNPVESAALAGGGVCRRKAFAYVVRSVSAPGWKQTSEAGLPPATGAGTWTVLKSDLLIMANA